MGGMTPALPLSNDFWVHSYLWATVANDARPYLGLFDAAGVLRLYLMATSGTTSGLYTRNAAGVSTPLGYFTLGGNTLNSLDLHVNYAAAGRITLYGNGGAVLIDYIGDVTTDGVTSLSKIGWQDGPNNGFEWSEFLVQSGDTRNAGVLAIPITGAGAVNTCDAGTYASVNSVGRDDTNFLQSLSVGETFLGTTGPVIPAGTWSVAGVAHAIRAAAGTGGGPQHVAPVKRIGGTNYTGSAISLGPILDNHLVLTSINPATTGPFSVSDITGGNLQIGIVTSA